MLESSGGNALHAAIAMCDRVSVYGTGMYSDSPSGNKMYVHASDKFGVAHCFSYTKSREGTGYRLRQGSRSAQLFRRWLTNRVRTEMALALLHTLGVVQWK